MDVDGPSSIPISMGEVRILSFSQIFSLCEGGVCFLFPASSPDATERGGLDNQVKDLEHFVFIVFPTIVSSFGKHDASKSHAVIAQS